MANVTITQLPQAGPILGTESVPIVQNGQTVQTTTAAIAASPSQTYQYLTVIQTPNLPNSRYLSAGSGLLLTDNGAQSTYTISLDSTLSSFNSALAGVMVKTNSSTVTNRTMAASGAGITVTNGNGVAGNPTYSLTGNVASLANASGNGMLTFINGIGVQPVTIEGTASEIEVTNGTGVSGNPTIGLADDPVLPGTGAVQIPGGTTAERPGPAAGKLRFNSDTGLMEYYSGTMWTNLSASSSTADNLSGGSANQIPVQNGPSSTTFIAAPTVANTYLEWSGSGFQWSSNPLGTVTSVDVSGGTTGLTTSGGPVTSSGTITIAGTLITSNGGTGLTTYTAGDITYYASGTALSKLAIGTNGQIITSSGTAPQWSDQSSLAVGTATNLAGGTAGALPYQTGAGATTFLSLGTATHILTAGASAPQYSDPSGITVGTATNVAGGTANQIVYNTAAGTTSFIAAPTVSNTYLEWSGSAFQWSANPLGTVTSVDISGGTTGLTTSGGPITSSGTITLAGTLAVANGGTGQTSYTDGELLIGNSTGNTLTKATLTAGSGISITNGSGSITIASTAGGGSVTSVDVSGGTTGLTYSGGPITTSGTITMAGTLITSNGGTGLTSYTAGDIVYYASGTALSKLGIGSSTYILTSSGTAPQWSDPAGVTVGTATNATNVTLTTSSTSSAFKVPFANTTASTTGNYGLLQDSAAEFTYNPSTNTLTAGTFSGALSGNATTATTLQTARTINGVSFDGSANITVTANTTNTLTLGSYLTGTSFNGSAAVTAAVDATTTNTASKVVARDASGNFAAGTITASLNGNASTATTATTATNATNVATTATSTNATFYPTFVDATTGNNAIEVDTDLTYNPSTNTLTVPNLVATSGISGGTF